MPFFLLRPALLGQVSVNDFLKPDECRSIVQAGERNLSMFAGTKEDHQQAYGSQISAGSTRTASINGCSSEFEIA
jgi:hypothetical protein